VPHNAAQIRAFDRSERIPCFGVVRSVALYLGLLEFAILIAVFWDALIREETT
jgi:hypothetical protein